MKKELNLEENLEETNYFIDYYTDRLYKSFREQEDLFDKARELLKNNQKPSKDFIKEVKKNQRNIKGFQANLRYLNDVQMFLEDEIELSKQF